MITCFFKNLYYLCDHVHLRVYWGETLHKRNGRAYGKLELMKHHMICKKKAEKHHNQLRMSTQLKGSNTKYIHTTLMVVVSIIEATTFVET